MQVEAAISAAASVIKKEHGRRCTVEWREDS
jgi:hypothetical protein